MTIFSVSNPIHTKEAWGTITFAVFNLAMTHTVIGLRALAVDLNILVDSKNLHLYSHLTPVVKETGLVRFIAPSARLIHTSLRRKQRSSHLFSHARARSAAVPKCGRGSPVTFDPASLSR